MYYLTLILAISFEIASTMLMRKNDGFTNFWPSILTVVLYASSIFFASIAVKGLQVGIVYAIWSSVSMVSVPVIAYFVYGEILDKPSLFGIALILSGVMVINIFGNVKAT